MKKSIPLVMAFAVVFGSAGLAQQPSAPQPSAPQPSAPPPVSASPAATAPPSSAGSGAASQVSPAAPLPTGPAAASPTPSATTRAQPSASPARVAPHRWDVDRVRCADLLRASDDDRASAAMFYYGYLAAKAGIHVINVSRISDNIARVMKECEARPGLTVPQAFRQALQHHRQG